MCENSHHRKTSTLTPTPTRRPRSHHSYTLICEEPEYEDVLQQEADLTAGHGVLRVTGLIAVSAPTVEELDAAVSAIEQAAIQASCETRRLVGQQAAAFTAAALPLARHV